MDDAENFKYLKFERMPRIYRGLRSIILLRLSGLEKNYLEMMDRIKVPLNATKLIAIFIKLILLLHIIACLWATSASFELYSNINWLVVEEIQDKNMYDKYMTAFYWAVVTTTTVGYGDIVPVNKFEIGLAISIIIIGVAYYSYVIGNLSFLFASILGEENETARRKAQIKKFLNVHDYPEEIIDSITIKKEEVEGIIEILPTNLKAQMLLVLFKEPISCIKILQNKDPHFIIDYLPKLQPIVVKSNTIIMSKNTFPADIFFVFKGSVKNKSNDKIFSEGSIIGETDIIYNRETRLESFVAIKESYLLRLDRTTLENLMEEIPEIKFQIEEIAHAREEARLNQKGIFYIGDKHKFLEKKKKMQDLLDKLDGKNVKPSIRKSSHNSESAYETESEYSSNSEVSSEGNLLFSITSEKYLS